MNKHCFTCGGHGFTDKACPECGRQPHSFNLEFDSVKAEKVVSAASSICVPTAYQGIVWSIDRLKNTHQEQLNDKLFERYCSQLDKIHTIFSTGVIPNKSAIIVAPAQHSKMTWAYSCMQFALLNGLKVAPLLDTLEVKRLIVLAAERPKQIYLGISFEDYINSDVVFITVTKTSYREEAYMVIEDVLDKRARRGLPTFFISRYSLATMSKRDYSGSFELIQDFNNTENSLKYPSIIQYWVYKSISERVEKNENIKL